MLKDGGGMAEIVVEVVMGLVLPLALLSPILRTLSLSLAIRLDGGGLAIEVAAFSVVFVTFFRLIFTFFATIGEFAPTPPTTIVSSSN